MDTWHWAMSVQQARAVGFGIEHLRSWHPRNQGMIVWQLNDCWPVTSWAMVDSAGVRKPIWHAVRHAYADRLMTIQPRDHRLALVLDNDTDEPWQTRVRLQRKSFDGLERAVSVVTVDVPPRGTQTLPLAAALTWEVSVRDEVLVATDGEHRALWFFGEDRDLHLTNAWAGAAAERTAGGYAVTVTAAHAAAGRHPARRQGRPLRGGRRRAWSPCSPARARRSTSPRRRTSTPRVSSTRRCCAPRTSWSTRPRNDSHYQERLPCPSTMSPPTCPCFLMGFCSVRLRPATRSRGRWRRTAAPRRSGTRSRTPRAGCCAATPVTWRPTTTTGSARTSG